MSKQLKIALLVILGILLVGLFYYLSPEKKEVINSSELGKEEMKLKLNKNGLYFIYHLLETSPNVVSLEQIENSIDTTLVAAEGSFPSVYILLDNEIEMTLEEQDSLNQFVKNGNVAFVSVLDFGSQFSEQFCYGDLTHKYNSEGVSLNFTHETYNSDYSYYFQRYQNNEIIYRQWDYFVPENFKIGLNHVTTISVDTYEETPVFVRVAYGKGYFYLHSIPEVFVNESMFTYDGFDYAQKVMSHLPKGHYKWHNHGDKWDVTNGNNSQDDIDKESPIQYILKDRSLWYAYLLAIFALLTYVLFKTKRKQKIIPTIEPNENSSLEFVETVSKLYLQQDKHYKFIKHYEQSFVHFIKDKYYISPQNLDAEYINLVALKSDVSVELIEKIVREFADAKRSYSYSTDRLIALHKKIEYFYKHCK